MDPYYNDDAAEIERLLFRANKNFKRSMALSSISISCFVILVVGYKKGYFK